MTEYLQGILEDKYRELCNVKKLLVREKNSTLLEEYKKSFEEKSEEIQEVIRECQTKEARDVLMRKVWE